MVHAKAYDKKNVVVTGGAGFLGSHLCDMLVQNHKVICIDDFSTGVEDNIHHLIPHPNFEFLRYNLQDPLALETIKDLKAFQVAGQGIQEVYHLASPSSPKDYTRLTIETLMTNALGTKNMLDIAVHFGAKFLIVSSGSIYGEPEEKTPFPENYWGYVDPVGVRSPYQGGKRFAEALTVAYRDRYKIEAKIVRLFNTYGPRMRSSDGRMMAEFISAALQDKSIVIHGDRDDTSTFTYVTDALEGIRRMMQSKEVGPCNIGNPEEHTVQEVAELVMKITGLQQPIQYEPRLSYNSRQATPNIRMAKEMLGWFPVVPLAEGLKRMVDDFRAAGGVGLKSLGYSSI